MQKAKRANTLYFVSYEFASLTRKMRQHHKQNRITLKNLKEEFKIEVKNEPSTHQTRINLISIGIL